MRKHGKNLGRLLISLAIALAFGYGFYGLFTYALPMSQDNFVKARTSYLAVETEILLNGGARAYDEGKLDEATRVLELELEKLIDKSGRYNAADRWKLERVFFLLGKAYQRQEKFDKAVQNYQDTLRINPNHLPAKYNLEMILMQGGGGEGSGQPQKGKPQHKI